MEKLKALTRLEESLVKLPSVGRRSAERMAYALLGMDDEDLEELSEALLNLKKSIHVCPICGFLTDGDQCEICNDNNRDKILKAYYKGILYNPKAALIKCMDRCNNLTTMSWGLSRERIYRMIKETEEYYPKLLDAVKATPEYNSAAWLLKYQIESMLDIYKRLM